VRAVAVRAAREQAGFALRVAGERPTVTPGSQRSPAPRAAIAAEKAAIMALQASPAVEVKLSNAGDACPSGHTPLARGGVACEQCQDCRCVQCGQWMGKPAGAFCAACRAEGGTA
jgi:hypothetical protein